MWLFRCKDRRWKEAGRDSSYSQYLLGRRKALHKLNEEMRESLLFHNLSPKGVGQGALAYSSRLYERPAGDSDFLALSLGYGAIPTSFKVKHETDQESGDPLELEKAALGDSYRYLGNMPNTCKPTCLRMSRRSFCLPAAATASWQ